MIQFILSCTMWAVPTVESKQVLVSEYAMAEIQHSIKDFDFEATVIEEKMNSLKITHRPTGAMTQAFAPSDYQQRSLSLRLDVANTQSSIDCDVKNKSVEN